MLNTKRKKRLLWQVIITSITLSIILAGLAIYTLYAPNIHLMGEDTYLYIKKDAVLDDLITQLEKKTDIKNTHTLLWVAEKMQYDRLIKPGRYKIDDRSSNLSLIRKLRSGNQDPMLLRFHNIRTKEQLAGK